MDWCWRPWKGIGGIGLKKIKYTPDAADKLRDMKSTITTQYGSKKAKEIVGEIMKSCTYADVHDFFRKWIVMTMYWHNK